MPTPKIKLLCQRPVSDFTAFKTLLLQQRDLSEESLEVSFVYQDFGPAVFNLDTKQLALAVERLLLARDRQEKVVIFGDYDVDGNCATAILWQGLKKLGLMAKPFIPHRLHHGYGMSLAALQTLFEDGRPDLIITVDNGISAFAALEFCREQKIEVIVTDHHQPLLKAGQPVLPPALAIVHSQTLSGAGVAWQVVAAAYQQDNLPNFEPEIMSLLDLVCLATLVDQVPLLGANRLLARAGLQQLKTCQRAGLLALLTLAKIEPSQVNSRVVGFNLGPKINAIGRLTNTLEALRLLCTTSSTRACQLAQTLTQVNTDRQELTSEMLDLALSQLDLNTLPLVIVVKSSAFHEGIIGLIASRLVELYGRPAIVLSMGEQIAKASARSIAGFDITAFLRLFREDLIDVGGHAAAAGFSVNLVNLPLVESKILSLSQQYLTPANLVPTLLVDCEVALTTFSNVDLLAQFLAELEPFGAGNLPPKIQVRGQVKACQFLGDQGQHLKLILADQTQTPLTLLCWYFADKKLIPPTIGQSILAVGELKVDEFRGQKQVALIVEYLT